MSSSDPRPLALPSFFTVLFLIATAKAEALADDFPSPPNTERSDGHSMSPEEVCRTAKLPPGFKLTAFASEPNVQNPIAITTDDRGRPWVAENYTWAGADAGNFDASLNDRIVILEDTDGDGQHDQRTVFFDQAKRLTSIQVGMGGVWALCSPQLLFIPDRNRDDAPDGPPEVILDGFDLETSTHTVANGLKWGPDGWLYGRQGILGTSHVGVPGADAADRVVFNTAIWRYHPTRRVCEVAMHGMTNPWGFDYNEYGEIFVTNTVIGHLWHVVPGARAERMFGQDFNPHAYQLGSQVADHVHWHTAEVWNDVRKGVTDRTSAAGGGHAHTGLLIYQESNWPAEYGGHMLTLNIHGRRINQDMPSRTATGYVAKHGADMCFIADPWFRGMDLVSGADGGVFVADWSDTGECHEMGGVHRTSGRIYKLTYGQPAGPKPFNLAEASDVELAQLQTNANDWHTRRARLLLQERAANNNLNTEAVREQLLHIFSSHADPVVRVRAMWALVLAQCVDEEWLVAQLQHPDEHVRVWAVRFLADAHGAGETQEWAQLAAKLEPLAAEEKSGLVLLHLAAALQKMQLELRWPLGRTLAMRSEAALVQDRTLAIMLWLAIEPYVAVHANEALELITQTDFPLLREDLARRLAAEIDRDLATVARLFDLAADQPQLAADIIRGVAGALNGRRSAPVPANWSTALSKLTTSANDETHDGLNSLGVVFNDATVLASLRQTVESPTAPPAARNRALQLVLAARPQDFHTSLCRLLQDRDLALEAIRGLAQYNDAAVPASLLDNYARFTAEQKSAAINTLASRINYARALVAALEVKRLATNDITAFQARQLLALGDSSLSDRFRVLWGDVRQTPEDKRQLMEDLRVTFTPKIASADLASGKALFTKTCASCHVLFGEGTKIGPDLTGSNRKNMEYLLENIIDPSAVVGADFRVTVFVLNDGRVLSGIVREQSERTLAVDTPEGRQVLDRKDIEEASVSEKSLMPDGALQTLTDAQIRDLLAYLMSD